MPTEEGAAGPDPGHWQQGEEQTTNNGDAMAAAMAVATAVGMAVVLSN